MIHFLCAMFKRFPGLFLKNILLLVVSGGLESLTLLTLVPVVDLFSFNNISDTGPVRRFLSAG